MTRAWAIKNMLWMLIAVVVGVRQALDYRSTGRAIGICLIGWIVQIVIFAVVGAVLSRPW